MKVSPISQNQYNSNNPSFNAVNQKYYEWGKKEIERFNELPAELLHRIEFDVTLYNVIKSEDGIDTLKALRELLKPQKNEWLNELIGEFKQLAKQERIEARRALKKIKKY